MEVDLLFWVDCLHSKSQNGLISNTQLPVESAELQKFFNWFPKHKRRAPRQRRTPGEGAFT